jgi:putative hemolysin
VGDALRILAVLALVAGNAFFVIGEYAVVTARRAALTPAAEAGSAGARAALRLMEDPVRVISTVQVGVTTISILMGALAEPLVRGLIGDAIPRWASFVIAFSVVTYLSVVFGELVPKALTLDRAERLVARVARPIELIALVLRPLVAIFERSASLFLRPFGVTEVSTGESIRSADELRALVDEAEGAGVIPRAQEELLHNVFDFAGQEARDIMVPALDVTWFAADLTAGEALKQAGEHAFSRYPVGRGSLDDLAGVVHVHDMISADAGATLGTIARAAMVVPETKDVGALLREMRERREHLAAVVDEYGQTSGIVTLEDVLEEIVGEIEDEYDLPDSRLEWLDDGEVAVAGSMSIDDFNETVGTDLPQRGPRTLAGLAFDALGRRPEPGDRVQVGDVGLAIEEVDGNRITRLRIAPASRARPD